MAVGQNPYCTLVNTHSLVFQKKVPVGSRFWPTSLHEWKHHVCRFANRFVQPPNAKWAADRWTLHDVCRRASPILCTWFSWERVEELLDSFHCDHVQYHNIFKMYQVWDVKSQCFQFVSHLLWTLWRIACQVKQFAISSWHDFQLVWFKLLAGWHFYSL